LIDPADILRLWCNSVLVEELKILAVPSCLKQKPWPQSTDCLVRSSPDRLVKLFSGMCWECFQNPYGILDMGQYFTLSLVCDEGDITYLLASRHLIYIMES